jgi:hypothetical protein
MAEKMLDPKYDYESRIAIPALLAMKDSSLAFEPVKKLFESKDANGKSIPELLRVECVSALAQCTTDKIGDMIPVQNDERVDEFRELFNKIAGSGTEYRLRFAALVALASPPFLTDDNLEKLLDVAEGFLRDESLPTGFRARVANVMMMVVLRSKDPQTLIDKRKKKAEDEAAAKKASEPKLPK